MTTTSKFLSVIALGMNRQSCAVLELALARHSDNYWQLSDSANADIAIIDGDMPDAANHYQQQRQQYPHQPVLVVAQQKPDWKRMSGFVAKPIKIESMISALDQLARELDRNGISPEEASAPPEEKSASPVVAPGDGAAPLPLPNAQFDVEACEQSAKALLQAIDGASDQRARSFLLKGRLLGALRAAWQEAGKQNSPVLFKGLPQLLVLSPADRVYYCELTEADRIALYQRAMTDDELSWTVISDSFFKDLLDRMMLTQCGPIDALLWEAAQWTACGRLPADVDPNGPVRLRRWPNLTRLLATPHSLRIAAFWEHNPVSPLQCARYLQLPERYVFAFFSGCWSLSLLEAQSELAIRITPSAQTEQGAMPQRGFLKRMIAFLQSIR